MAVPDAQAVARSVASVFRIAISAELFPPRKGIGPGASELAHLCGVQSLLSNFVQCPAGLASDVAPKPWPRRYCWSLPKARRGPLGHSRVFCAELILPPRGAASSPGPILAHRPGRALAWSHRGATPHAFRPRLIWCQSRSRSSRAQRGGEGSQSAAANSSKRSDRIVRAASTITR